MADDYDSDASDGGSVSGASDVMDTSFSRKRGASTVRRRYGHLGHNALYQVSDIVVVAVAAASLVYIVVSLQTLHRSPSLDTRTHCLFGGALHACCCDINTVFAAAVRAQQRRGGREPDAERL